MIKAEAPTPKEALDGLVGIIFNRCPTVEGERREIMAARDIIEAALAKPEESKPDNVLPLA